MFHSTTEEGIVGEIKTRGEKAGRESHEILFHHRMPTSTANVLSAAHPFSTGRFFNHNYVLAHNGIIHNDGALKKQHEERGIKYHSVQEDGRFNDSEALLWEVAMYLEGIKSSIGTMGGAAFIVVESKFTKTGTTPFKLHFGRNSSNPLWLELNDDELILASESSVSDSGVSIMPEYLYTFDYRTHKLSVKPMELETYRFTAWSKTTSTGVPVHSNWKPKGKHATHSDYGNPRTHDADYWESYWEEREADMREEREANVAVPTDPKTAEADALNLGLELMTQEELEQAATDLIDRYTATYKTSDEVEWQIKTDLKRARQASTNISQSALAHTLSKKSKKKLAKYAKFFAICVRAMVQLQLVLDDEEVLALEAKSTTNPLEAM
jgi:Glutamine amidotransferase domain